MPRLPDVETVLPAGFKVLENLPHEGVVVICDYCGHEDTYGTGPDADQLLARAVQHRAGCKRARVAV